MKGEARAAGCCAVCHTPIQEVVARTSRDADVLPGTPIAFGDVLSGAQRLTLVLASGRTANLSICGDCDLQPADYPAVWQGILRAQCLESDNVHRERMRRGMGASISDLSEAEQWLHLQNWLSLRDDVPLGILARQAWEDLR